MFSPLILQLLFVVVLQKIEARVAADEDLKLADLLKYYLRESQAAKVRLLTDSRSISPAFSCSH